MRLLQTSFANHAADASHKIPRIFPLRQRAASSFRNRLLSAAGALAFSFYFAVLPGCSSFSVLTQDAPKHPLEIKVRGWHVEVQCFPITAGYSYGIKSSTRREPVKIGEGENSHYDGVEIDRGNPYYVTAAFPLITRDTVRISAVQTKRGDGGKQDTAYSIDTLIVPKSYRVSYGSTLGFAEDTLAVRQAQDWALRIDEINSDPRINVKAKLFVPCARYPGAHHLEYRTSEGDVSEAIHGSTTLLSPAYIFLWDNCSNTAGYTAPFHEISHIFFFSAIDSAKRGALEAIFNRRADALDSAWNSLEAPDSSRGAESFVSFAQFAKSDPFFMLFSEVAYSDDGGGHPYDNTSELFASASTVMKYFTRRQMANAFHKFLSDTSLTLRNNRQDFFARLEGLEKTDPETAADAREVAKIVAEAYLPKKPFPLSVYQKLGIFTEAKEPQK
jgi:hypothetical protein